MTITFANIPANHAVVEADGYYGSLSASGGTAWLRMTNPAGAVVTVEASHDGGETWHVHHKIDASEYRSELSFIRPYFIVRATRMRLHVTGFTRQFKYWLERGR